MIFFIKNRVNLSKKTLTRKVNESATLVLHGINP